jgi:sulfur relay (sulfurtransferase) DsrF/TusC family protein
MLPRYIDGSRSRRFQSFYYIIAVDDLTKVYLSDDSVFDLLVHTDPSRITTPLFSSTMATRASRSSS